MRKYQKCMKDGSLKSSKSYYLSVILSVLVTLVVLIIPENAPSPFPFFRALVAIFFIIALPGPALLHAVHKMEKLQVNSHENSFDRFVVGLSLSLVLVAIVSLIFHFIFNALNLIPITVCLQALTILFLTVAFYYSIFRSN